MSGLTILSDAELDAVSGGILNGGAGGAGGAGGSGGNNGAVVTISDFGFFDGDRANLSVNGSTANANGGRGGNGGDVSIRVSLGGRR